MPKLETLVVVLWIITLLSYALPPMLRTADRLLRGHLMPTSAFLVFALFVLVTTFNVGTAIATKSEPTNPPPATVECSTKIIRLYVTSPDGRLVPLGAQIKGVVTP